MNGFSYWVPYFGSSVFAPMHYDWERFSSEITPERRYFWEIYQKYYVYIASKPECAQDLFFELEEIEAGIPQPHVESFQIALIAMAIILISF